MALKATGDDDMEYREMMGKIAKRVDGHTLEELKYQCRDVIGPGKLETVTTAQNLFEVLEERDEINVDEVEFLYKILKNVDRIDLCKVVKSYMDSRNTTSTEGSAENCPSVYNAPNIHGPDIPHNSVPPKFFSQNESLIDPHKLSKDSFCAVSQGDNCSTPFDTSDDAAGGFFVPHISSQQVINQTPSAGTGHSIPPELATALEFVTSSISRGWQSAARHLGVPDAVIDHAEENWPRNIRNQIGEAFRYWARNDRHPSVQKLIQTMRRVGRNDLADELEYNQ